MCFYRPLGRISALILSLDDTPYDNRPVIIRTEQEALAFVQNYHPTLNSLQNSDLRCLCQAVRNTEPEIYHDVTQWRHRIIECAMLEAGLLAVEARMGANAAMVNFVRWHNHTEILQPTHDMLKALARKWPSATTTNSNTQSELFGPGDYFEFMLRAGPDGRSKPFSDMYALAAEKLEMPVDEILHVGGNLTADVAGAIRCDMQACWTKPGNTDLVQTADSHLLLYIEISRLASLTPPV